MSFAPPSFAGRARNRAAGRPSAAGSELDGSAAKARAWALDRADEARDTIQTKPFVAVGTVLAGGFGLGLLIGLAISRD